MPDLIRYFERLLIKETARNLYTTLLSSSLVIELWLNVVMFAERGLRQVVATPSCVLTGTRMTSGDGFQIFNP